MSRRLSSYTARERRWMAARPLHGGLNSQDASWICVAAPAGRSSAGITSGRGSSRLSKREIPPPPTRSKPTTSPASLLLSREGFVCHCAERSAAYASGARRRGEITRKCPGPLCSGGLARREDAAAGPDQHVVATYDADQAAAGINNGQPADALLCEHLGDLLEARRFRDRHRGRRHHLTDG